MCDEEEKMSPLIQGLRRSRFVFGLTAACLLGASAWPATAASSDDVADLRQRVDDLTQTAQQQQQLIDQLLTANPSEKQGVVDAYRRQAIKKMIDDVLAESNFNNTNLSTAFVGYDKGLVITDANEKFKTRINGSLRMRYIANAADRAGGADESNNGLQVRSSSIGISGYAYSKKIQYGLSGKYESGTNALKLGSAFIGYQFSDNWLVRVGTFNPVFLRESVTELQTIDQSLMRELFQVDTTDAIQLQYAENNRRFTFAFHDGSKQKLSDIDSDNTEFSVLGRAEVAFLGCDTAVKPLQWFSAAMGNPFHGAPNWGQWSTPQGWSKSKPGVIVGAAINYEQGERGAGTSYKDLLKYTFDIGTKGPGWNIYAAFVGESRDTPTGSTYLSGERYAALIQGGVFAVPDEVELFARYEYLDLGGIWSDTTAATDNSINMYTVGVNWFIRKHATKISLDLLYTPDAITADIDSYGLLASQGDQFIARLQFQFKF